MAGSIAKRANGKWLARYRDDNRKEHSKQFDRKIDGQRWLNEVTAARVTGTYVDPSSGTVTLQEFYAEWSTRQVWAHETVRAMNLAMKTCTFTDIPFARLRRSHVEQWVKQMTDTLAPNTVRARFNNIRSVLRAAVRDRYLAADPSEGVTLPRRRRVEHAMRIPTVEEVAAVIDAADPHFRAFVNVAAFAGLRSGEVAGLQLGDVEFLHRRLNVTRQVQRADGTTGVLVNPPKYGSERQVYIPADLTAVLSTHVENIGTVGDEGWLFMGSDGLPPDGNAVHYRWTKAVKAAGVQPFKLHDLRHFYASGLIAAGCDVVTVQRALGHHSATVTLNTYSHLWPNAEDRTRAAAADLMRAVQGGPADQMRTVRAV